MDTKKIIEMYTVDKKTLRLIARELNTNHNRIKRILLREGIEITSKNRVRKKLSDEDKKKRSERALKQFKEKGHPIKGKKATKLQLYKNMKGHLSYNVSLEWLLQFEDIEKLKFLNKSITKERNKKGFNTEIYQSFITKFYIDKQFNKIYSFWIDNKQDKYLKPSLDHIVPRSKGGELANLNNMQFLTWFENRCKNDMSMQEWNNLKNKINNYLL